MLATACGAPAFAESTGLAAVSLPLSGVPAAASQSGASLLSQAQQSVTSAKLIAEVASSKPGPLEPRPLSIEALHDLVISFIDRGNADAEEECLASAVYFEARSEPLEGQLAVAKVVLNRAASGAYPTSICEVVKQPAQFSFVRRGRLPTPDKASDCWHRALAIADVARNRVMAGAIASNVLWYHASYVTPSWGRLRTRIAQIGRHIFFS